MSHIRISCLSLTLLSQHPKSNFVHLRRDIQAAPQTAKIFPVGFTKNNGLLSYQFH